MFILHFIADFLLQSREMGKNKSSNYTYLFKHISIIFAVIFVALIPFLGLKLAFVFAFYNALVHMIIDKFIWNIYKYSAHIRIINQLNDEHYPTNSMDHSGYALDYEYKVKSWKYYEDHWFYATIGFDQLLHALTLIAIAGLLL